MFKLLIADDEEITRKGLLNYVRWSELELEVVGDAPDGRRALELFMQNPADIVISDIRMPFMDGLELTQSIKDIDPSVIVILLSAYGDFEYAQRAVKLGVFDYILKPIDVDVLSAVTLNAIGAKKRAMEQNAELTALMNFNDLEFFASDTYLSVLRVQEELLEAVRSGDEVNSRRLSDEIYRELLSRDATLAFAKRFASEFLSQLVRCMIAIHEKPDFLISDTDSRIRISRMESHEAVHSWLSDVVLKTCATVQSRRSGTQKKVINEILKYIHENYADNKLTLSTISEKFFFSPNYLSAVFKTAMGIGFLEFLTNYRIEKSKELLSDIKHKVYEIAAAVGYSDSHYFSRIFKECTGMTPKEYRDKTI